MKSILSVLIGLILASNSYAQTYKIQKVKRTYQGSVQRGQARRNMNDYPATSSGTSAFLASVNSGCQSITLTNGTVTAISGNCNGTTPPSWITGLQYKHNGTTLSIQSSGDVAQLMFNTNPATSFATTNPDGGNLHENTFYNPGIVTNIPYNHQWEINLPTQPMRVTVKNSSGSTYDRAFTPNPTGSTFVALVGTAVQPTGPPTSTTGLVAFNRVLFIGNSILQHDAAPQIGWYLNNGMAASAPDKDWRTIVKNALATANPNVDARNWGDFPIDVGLGYFHGTSHAEGGYWESSYWNLDGGMDRYQRIADWMPDLVVIRLSENVSDLTHDFAGNLALLVDKLKSKNPTCKFIVTNSVWGQVDVSSAFQSFATSRNYTFVNLLDMWSNTNYYAFGQYSNAGVASHPNDAGHAEIARRIIAKLPTTTVVTPPVDPGSGTNPPATAYYSNGYGEGSVDQLMQSAPFVPTTNQYSTVWTQTGNSSQYLDNGIIRFGIGRAIGGAIKWLSLSGAGQKNWVNTNAEYGGGMFEGEYSPDTGRSGGWSLYGTPGHGYTATNGYGNFESTANSGYDTGENPVHGGSYFGDRSKITWFEKRTVAGYGEVMYCRTTPYEWALHNTLAPYVYHCYWWLEGNAVRYYSIIENKRNDNQMAFQGRQSEMPFIYTTADLWHHYVYDGNAPGTGDALTDISSPNMTGGGQHFSEQYNTTEGWVASVNDAGNGVILLPQHNAKLMGGQFNERGGDEFSNAASYINSSALYPMDVQSTFALGGYIYVGNLNTFRSWFNGKNIARPGFSFNFGTGNTAGWWSLDTPAKFNSDNRYEFQLGRGDGAGGRLVSPVQPYKCADMPTLYIKGKFTGVSRVLLYYVKPRQGEAAAINAGQYVEVAVNGNGSEQTVSVNMNGKPGWSGYFSTLRIEPHFSDSHNASQKFVPSYIGNVQPNSASDLQTLIGLSILAAAGLRRRRKTLGIRAERPKAIRKLTSLTMLVLLVGSFFSCQYPVADPVSTDTDSHAGRVMYVSYDPISDGDAWEEDRLRHFKWSMYGPSSGDSLRALLNDTSWTPVEGGSVYGENGDWRSLVHSIN